MNKVVTTLLAAFFLFPAASAGAELAYQDFGNGRYLINLRGEITTGDAARLEALITSQPEKYLRTNSMRLESPGGSVLEAMLVADVVERAALGVSVERDAICASACFFIWAAADYRLSYQTSRIIIHRPYFPTESVSVENFSSASAATMRTTSIARNYLVDRGVSSAIVDKMMTLPSTEGYELTAKDRTDFGFMAPVLEEKAIAACGVSNATLLSNPDIQQAGVCIAVILAARRPHYLIQKMGRQKAKAAMVASGVNTMFKDGVEVDVATGDPATSDGALDQYLECALREYESSHQTGEIAADLAIQKCEAHQRTMVRLLTAEGESHGGSPAESTSFARDLATDTVAAIRKRLVSAQHEASGKTTPRSK